MHYINGAWVDGSGPSFASINPATGEEIWRGNAASDTDVQAAITAARAAFPAWAALGYDGRLEYLERMAKLLESQKDILATLISQEVGKAPWDAKAEAAGVIGKLAFSKQAYGERTAHKSRETPIGTSVLQHRPHGVMAVFGPYNFPAHLPNGHIMPALLAGNTIVFKPSEQTPLVAEWTVKQWEAAGLPRGVINLIQGERETGMALSKGDINGLLFTGSSATGIALHKQFAGRPEVMLALEMGGNNPLIVTDVADIPGAVHETLVSAYLGTGQRCTCARRLMVIEWPGANAFIAALVEGASKLRIGAYDETPEPFMGPLISMKEADRLLAAQDMLEKLGGKVLLRMKRLRDNLPFVSPGVIDMTGVADAPDEEYFGPLLKLYRVKEDEEAVALANATKFGLSSAIFTDDASRFQSLSAGLHAGLINWNRPTTGNSGVTPFGGVGISGNHHPAGYYAADYCAYPVASVEVPKIKRPEKPSPGIEI